MNVDLTNNWIIFLIIIVAVWELAWKYIALWQAARRAQKGWFIIFILINSAGILPIIYLLLHKNTPKQATTSKNVSD
jgi:uncharacterized protein DUF5652